MRAAAEDGSAIAEARARAAAAEDRLRSQTLVRAQAEHRLKTSLAVVTGWAATLDDRWDQLTDERRREAVVVIRRASEEMACQARRLLEDARAEMLVLDLTPIPVDLCDVLDLTAVAFAGISPSHRVEHLTSGDTVVADVDPTALQQVLGHLLENAVKYSPEDSLIALRVLADPEHGCAVVEIRDEGVGLPDGVDLFAPFQRASANAAVPGVGLGLYIVRNLVQAMGGEVTAWRNPDRGSTFAVQVPMHAA